MSPSGDWERCGLTSRSLSVCVRKKGHPGDHSSRVGHRWANTSTAERTLAEPLWRVIRGHVPVKVDTGLKCATEATLWPCRTALDSVGMESALVDDSDFTSRYRALRQRLISMLNPDDDWNYDDLRSERA